MKAGDVEKGFIRVQRESSKLSIDYHFSKMVRKCAQGLGALKRIFVQTNPHFKNVLPCTSKIDETTADKILYFHGLSGFLMKSTVHASWRSLKVHSVDGHLFRRRRRLPAE